MLQITACQDHSDWLERFQYKTFVFHLISFHVFLNKAFAFTVFFLDELVLQLRPSWSLLLSAILCCLPFPRHDFTIKKMPLSAFKIHFTTIWFAVQNSLSLLSKEHETHLWLLMYYLVASGIYLFFTSKCCKFCQKEVSLSLHDAALVRVQVQLVCVCADAIHGELHPIGCTPALNQQSTGGFRSLSLAPTLCQIVSLSWDCNTLTFRHHKCCLMWPYHKHSLISKLYITSVLW